MTHKGANMNYLVLGMGAGLMVYGCLEQAKKKSSLNVFLEFFGTAVMLFAIVYR